MFNDFCVHVPSWPWSSSCLLPSCRSSKQTNPPHKIWKCLQLQYICSPWSGKRHDVSQVLWNTATSESCHVRSVTLWDFKSLDFGPTSVLSVTHWRPWRGPVLCAFDQKARSHRKDWTMLSALPHTPLLNRHSWLSRSSNAKCSLPICQHVPKSCNVFGKVKVLYFSGCEVARGWKRMQRHVNV